MASAKKKTTRLKSAKPKKIVKPMTPAEMMCDHVDPSIKAQAVTLANAVLTMQEKIEQQIPVYKRMPLAQQVTVGTGEKMLRQNPAVQEFRATVRDYSQALNNLKAIVDNNAEPVEIDDIADVKRRFNLAK